MTGSPNASALQKAKMHLYASLWDCVASLEIPASERSTMFALGLMFYREPPATILSMWHDQPSCLAKETLETVRTCILDSQLNCSTPPCGEGRPWVDAVQGLLASENATGRISRAWEVFSRNFGLKEHEADTELGMALAD